MALILAVRSVQRFLNSFIINKFARAATPRPKPFSLMAGFTSWQSLSDKSFTGRHLPEATHSESLPDIADIVDLWRRPAGQETLSTDTSVLFSFFAQWFTDSFLRTDPTDRRKNISNHEIDFCQLYGVNSAKTDILRSKSGGKLKCQILNGEFYPPFLFDPETTTKSNWHFASPEFERLHDVNRLASIFHTASEESIKCMFVTGLEHGNSNPGYLVLNVLALREHNRICDALAKAHPDWDDERYFQTARNIMIVLLLKIVISDYIKHIATIDFPFSFTPGFAEKERWYRSNWITLEFNLLYRWHSLVPNNYIVGNTSYTAQSFRSNPTLLLKYSIEELLTAASTQFAGKIGLQNTAELFFNEFPIGQGPETSSVQKLAVQMSRDYRIRTVNEYRKAFGLDAFKSFEQLTGNTALADRLQQLYGSINDVEWYVGINAESHRDGQMMGDLMTSMVAFDAFTHALTNPLMSTNVHNEATFSKTGLEIIGATNSLSDFARRNLVNPKKAVVSFSSIREVPGRRRFPLPAVIWQTYDFLYGRGWHKYVSDLRRQYRTSVSFGFLFEPTIIVTDWMALQVFHDWDGRLRKDHRFGWARPPIALTGEHVPSVFLPEPKHQELKSIYTGLIELNGRGFSMKFETVFGEFSHRWTQTSNLKLAEEIERFVLAFVFEWLAGSRPNVDEARFIYNNIFLHIPLWLQRALPWSSYRKSIPMSLRLHDFVRRSEGFRNAQSIASPTDKIDGNELVAQLTFLMGMNGYLGLQCLSKSIVGELSRNEGAAGDLRKELECAESELGKKRLLGAELAGIRGLDHFVKEVLRLHPPVSFIYGRANSDFVLQSTSGSFAIRKDDHLMGAIPFVHCDSENFSEPLTFRPARYSIDSAAEALVWPHGQHNDSVSATNHICPGKDVALLFAKLFCYEMVRNFAWELRYPPVWSDRKFSLNVAAPQGNLSCKYFRSRTF